jgi:hypothetical protein
MSDKKPDIAVILNDLAKDLDGQKRISDTFHLQGHTWEMQLLNEEEGNWRNAHIVAANKLAMLSSFRLPTLAIAIRRIDGVSVEEFFSQKWDNLDAQDRVDLQNMSKYAKKYFMAEHLMEFLSQRPPDAIEDLFLNGYDVLQKREADAQDTLKKYSGEGSEKEKSGITIESSPTGDE